MNQIQEEYYNCFTLLKAKKKVDIMKMKVRALIINFSYSKKNKLIVYTYASALAR